MNEFKKCEFRFVELLYYNIRNMVFIRWGIDLRLSKSNNGFMNLPKHLWRLMSDWFITKDKVDANDDMSEGTIE